MCSRMLGSEVWVVSQVVSWEFCLIVTGCVQKSILDMLFFAICSRQNIQISQSILYLIVQSTRHDLPGIKLSQFHNFSSQDETDPVYFLNLFFTLFLIVKNFFVCMY